MKAAWSAASGVLALAGCANMSNTEQRMLSGGLTMGAGSALSPKRRTTSS
ncbi:MAG: hypothetical protein ACREEP_12220 [Dongiaceae bacterium]